MSDLGVWCVMPTISVFVLAMITKKTTLSLVIGCLFASVLLSGPRFGAKFVEAIYGVMRSDLWIWIILVCGFFGSLVFLFEKSGGIYGFDKLLSRICRSRRSTLVTTWVLGLMLFVDDWLSILTNGNAMKRMADKHGVPREMLAYTCNTLASSACVLVPISTWGVFMMSQLVSSGIADSGDGMSMYFSAMKYMIYPMVALVFSLLYGMGILPVFGPMKKAFKRVETEADEKETGTDESVTEKQEDKKVSSPLNFIIPIITLIIVSVATGEILYGALVALILCGIMYLPQRLMKVNEYLDGIVKGFGSMLPVFFIMTAAFMLRDLNDMMDMPDYVIGKVSDGVPAWILPAVAYTIVFLMGLTAANFWGICAIAFPVIIPIAQAIGGDLLLSAGAIISATASSSQMCFYGSEAALTCQTTEIDNAQYFRSAGALMIPQVIITVIIFLVLGYVVT
ncbi:MAG: hypothetical protein IKS63_02275 [Firmicutes bacterium]|nr:hypothetical protein [Bacillota bacterium]